MHRPGHGSKQSVTFEPGYNDSNEMLCVLNVTVFLRLLIFYFLNKYCLHLLFTAMTENKKLPQ